MQSATRDPSPDVCEQPRVAKFRVSDARSPIRRIGIHFGLPADYFPEVREAAVIDAIRRRPRLRDSISF